MITLSLCALCTVLWPYDWRGNKRPDGPPAVQFYRQNLRGRR